MPYYVAERKFYLSERVIVKADNVGDAFVKVSEDVDCVVISENESDYETNYSSIYETAFISEKTKAKIEASSK